MYTYGTTLPQGFDDQCEKALFCVHVSMHVCLHIYLYVLWAYVCECMHLSVHVCACSEFGHWNLLFHP